MQNLEVVLEQTAQGDTVVKGKNLSVNVEMNNGNIQVMGQQESTLLGGRQVTSSLPETRIRLAETEQLLSGTNLSAEQRDVLEAKQDVWAAFHTTVKAAFVTALKASYLIDNPTPEA